MREKAIASGSIYLNHQKLVISHHTDGKTVCPPGGRGQRPFRMQSPCNFLFSFSPGAVLKCNGEIYDNATHVCCEGSLFELIDGWSTCCGPDAFNEDTQLCCPGNTILMVSHLISLLMVFLPEHYPVDFLVESSILSFGKPFFHVSDWNVFHRLHTRSWSFTCSINLRCARPLQIIYWLS